MKGTNAGGGHVERGAQVGFKPGECRIKIGQRDLPAQRRQIDTIEFCGQFGNGIVAAGAHGSDDRGDIGADIGIAFASVGDQRCKRRGKTRIARIKPLRHCRVSPQGRESHRQSAPRPGAS